MPHQSRWIEHPQKYSKIHKAERRSKGRSGLFLSKIFFPRKKKGCIAEDKGKSRWLPSQTLTHKRPAVFQKTGADTASSKESRGQSIRKSRSAGNMSVFDLSDTEYHSYKSPTGNSELKKVTDQLHPHCPPFVSPSAPLCSADGCGSTE